MSAASPHIVLFDPYAGGHHGHHLVHLARWWAERQRPGRLTLAVPPTYREAHPDVYATADALAGAGIALAEIPPPRHAGASGAVGVLRRDTEHGRLLAGVARRLEPDHVVAMSFDQVQLSLARGLRLPDRTTLSGLYYRPTFHYPLLHGDGRLTARDRVKRTVLRRALRHRAMRALFCLDPYVVPHVGARGVEVVALPDGIERTPARREPEAVRAALGVEAGRRLLLLFGVLDRRKGVQATLEAMLQVPEAAAGRLSLALAGRIAPAERAEVLALVERVRAQTAVQVVQHDGFVDEDDIQDFFRAADVALVPYVRHVGSSGVLVRAAAEGVPVVGSDYGVVGAHIRRHRLGLAVDTTDADALAGALAACAEGAVEAAFDTDAARAFAQANTLDAFCETIFAHVG